MRSNKRTTTPKDVANADETAVNNNEGVEKLGNKSVKASDQAQETNLTAVSYPRPEIIKPVSKPIVMVEEKHVSNKSQYIEALLSSIIKVKPVGGELAIDLKLFYRYHIPKNFKLFEILLKSDVNFYFTDPKNPGIKQYTNKEVRTICDYCSDIKKNHLAYKTTDQGVEKQKIRNAELLSASHKDLTSQKRTQKSYFDPTNVKVRLEIYKLQLMDFNDNKIAKTLNANGWFSARGGTYTAKQISRIVEVNQKLIELFKAHPMEEEYLQVENNRNLPVLPIESVVCLHEINLICVKFSVELKDSVYVKIVDNRERDKFGKSMTPISKEIKINILKDTTMYPGRNYVLLSNPKYCEYRAPIDVHPEFLPEAVSNVKSN